jgi:hypothetical protein
MRLFRNEALLFGKQLRRAGHEDIEQPTDLFRLPGSRQAGEGQVRRLPDKPVAVLHDLSDRRNHD